MTPTARLDSLSARFDQLTLREWCIIGNRASCIESAFYYNPTRQAASQFLGSLWLEVEEAVHRQALAFCQAAHQRQEMKVIDIGRYLDMGLAAALGAVAEQIFKLISAEPGGQAPHWFLDGFDLLIAHP